MEHQNQVHAFWKNKKDNFNKNISNKWRNSVNIPKFLKKQEKDRESTNGK